jgi:alkylation response protein AidB-like acyl-CoA dehydrogenase
VAHPLAEAKIELELARLMTQKAAALYGAGAPGAGETANMAKYAAAEAGIHCVDRAIQAHGGNGFALEYGLSDLWWKVRVARTAPVSREMVLNYVAEHSLGLPSPIDLKHRAMRLRPRPGQRRAYPAGQAS